MDKLQLTTLKVCPFFPQKFRLFIDMSPSFAFLHRSGFLISHHGSFMGVGGGGPFHVGLGLFHGFVKSQAAAQCHFVLRKNLFLFKRLPPSGHQKNLFHTL